MNACTNVVLNLPYIDRSTDTPKYNCNEGYANFFNDHTVH